MRALGSLPRQLSRLGWPGALAAALAVCGAGLYLSLLQPAQERLDALRGEALARQQQLQRNDSPAEEGDTPASQLARFHQAFPALATLPEVLDRMFAVARRQGVALEQGDYRLTRNAAGQLVRIQIALPVKSNYPQIRRFIAGLKTEIPAVALENVQFARQKVADANVEATIKLALYMEPTP